MSALQEIADRIDDARGARYRVVAIELTDPPESVEVDGCDGVYAIVRWRHTPVGAVVVAARDEYSCFQDGPLTTDRVLERVQTAMSWEIWRSQLKERLRDGLAADPFAAPHVSVTAVVCTRDRRDHLGRCLRALAALDPAPERVIVVDNASEVPCRAEVESFGFTYVSEPQPGLDNARNRALAMCATDVIVFTDDDCVAEPGWLRSLDRHFRNPATAGVCGIGCPYRLESAAQIEFEVSAGFSLGFREQRFDWERIRPTDAAAVGAGANMAFRADLLREIGGFPPELDVGTPTRSGGDIYAMSRLLAAGYRIIYDPGQMVWHDHRADVPAFRRAMHGYGVGVAAMATRSVVRDHELGGLVTATWPVRHLASVLLKRRPRSDTALRGSLDAVRGGLAGPFAWRRALRAAPPAPAFTQALPDRDPTPSSPAPSRRRSQAADGPVELTVVIPTIARRRLALERCLEAIEGQSLERDRFEVVVVPNGTGAARVRAPSANQVISIREPSAGAARNAGAAAARGATLVFVDDDVLLERDCLAAHLAVVEEHGGVSLGPYPPAEFGATPISHVAARWWCDHFERKHRTDHRFSFVDFITGNVALPRELFAATGGFDPGFPTAHREDWELGFRLLTRGVSFRANVAAVGWHHHAMTPEKWLNDSRARGFGDVILATLHPVTLANLPLRDVIPLMRSPRWRKLDRIGRLATTPASRAPLLAGLAPMAAAGLRGGWLRAFRTLSGSAYVHGVQRALDAGFRVRPATKQVTQLDLGATAPLALGPAIGDLEVSLDGLTLGAVSPPDGQWDSERLIELALDWFGFASAVSLANRQGP